MKSIATEVYGAGNYSRLRERYTAEPTRQPEVISSSIIWKRLHLHKNPLFDGTALAHQIRFHVGLCTTQYKDNNPCN